jgi:flavin-dependent dehydrogenase
VAALGARPIKRLRLLCGGEQAVAALPFAAAGVSRRVLDEALLGRAAAAGVRVLRGTAVRRLRRIGQAWAADTDSCGAIQAHTLFLATGKHDIRGVARPQHSRVVGLKMYFALSPDEASALGESIELVLFGGGYAGLQLVETNCAVLCWLMPSCVLRGIGHWPAVLEYLTDRSVHLGRRLSGSRPLLVKPLAVAGIPYGFLNGATGTPGLFRLGDQAGVIPSLAGDGVAIALHSGRLAAETWLANGGSEARYRKRLWRDLVYPVRMAGIVHGLCRNSTMQAGIVAACRGWPGLMQWAARQTRVVGSG